MDIYREIESFCGRAETESRIFGKSAFGRNLYALKRGEGRPVCLAQYAIHGREYVTAKLALAHLRLGTAGTLWVVPLANPDGALLSECGLLSAPAERRAEPLRINGSDDFSLWKANGRAVDLNVNFPADWGRGARNVRAPASENYIGPTPLSEPESRALKELTEALRPDFTVSYHTKGEEIYWHYHQPLSACARDKRLAQALSDSTGYPLCRAAGSTGGYKDWCIARLHIPAFTVEAGKDGFSHPLGEREYADVERHNLYALRALAEEWLAAEREGGGGTRERGS